MFWFEDGLACTCHFSLIGGDIIPKRSYKLEQAREKSEEICTLYKEGETLYNIKELTGVSRGYVAKILDECCIRKFKTKNELENEQEKIIEENLEYILESYDNNVSILKLCEEMRARGVIIGTRRMKKILESAGKVIKSAKDYNQKYYCDETAFSTYDKFSCYWAGLLAADGCIYKRKDSNSMYVILTLTEELLVQGFKEYIKYTGKVSKLNKKTNFSKETTVWEVRCLNNQICENLKINFNLEPHKTLVYDPPQNIPKELIKYFILGYIDGDGSIAYYVTSTGRKQFNLNITGTHETISFIADYFNKANLKLFSRYPKKNNNNITLNIQGNDQLYSILSNLYCDEDINSICMERKYKKYLELKEQQETKYKMASA